MTFCRRGADWLEESSTKKDLGDPSGQQVNRVSMVCPCGQDASAILGCIKRSIDSRPSRKLPERVQQGTTKMLRGLDNLPMTCHAKTLFFSKVVVRFKDTGIMKLRGMSQNLLHSRLFLKWGSSAFCPDPGFTVADRPVLDCLTLDGCVIIIDNMTKKNQTVYIKTLQKHLCAFFPPFFMVCGFLLAKETSLQLSK